MKKKHTYKCYKRRISESLRQFTAVLFILPFKAIGGVIALQFSGDAEFFLIPILALEQASLALR